MENIETREGVVVELHGEFWGEQRPGCHLGLRSWGPVENATIYNPELYKKPTDITHDPDKTGFYNPEFVELSRPGVQLIPVKKTIKTSFYFTLPDSYKLEETK